MDHAIHYHFYDCHRLTAGRTVSSCLSTHYIAVEFAGKRLRLSRADVPLATFPPHTYLARLPASWAFSS